MPNKIEQRFSAAVRDQLCKAGWYEGRDVGMKNFRGSQRTLNDPALNILREFGDIEVDCITKPLARKKKSWNPFGEIIWQSTYDDVAGRIKIQYDDLEEVSAVLSQTIGGDWACVGYLDYDSEILVNEQQAVVIALNDLNFWASNWDSFLERILTGSTRESPPRQLQPGTWPLPER